MSRGRRENESGRREIVIQLLLTRISINAGLLSLVTAILFNIC